MDDITTAKLTVREIKQRVETYRFGPFTFQIAVNTEEINTLYLRVLDAHARFSDSPLSQVANQLEKEVMVNSIFGTNTIENGTLSKEETELALELDPTKVEEESKRRAINLKLAYEIAKNAATTSDWRLSLDYIREIHSTVTDKLTHEYNKPGQWRDNPKGFWTYVGDVGHGGRYKPPQNHHDIATLMAAMIDWHNNLQNEGVPALIRAPLIHFYYERIHPFWDGNGRVGRVLEATLLQADGFRYAPFAMSQYYLDHIDHYFALFNHCRKAESRGENLPNTRFVAFHLQGMLESINRLHDRVNVLVAILLFQAHIRTMFENKEINARQYTILTNILIKPLPLNELRKAPWYQSLYLDKTARTRERDLRKLFNLELVFETEDNKLLPKVF